LAKYRVLGHEGYVPFWNVVGREWLGQEAEYERHSGDLTELRELASQSAATSTLRQRAATEPSPRPSPAPDGSARELFPPYVPAADELRVPKTSILGPEALGHFFRQLTRVELGHPGAIARAGHWGDSILGNDGVSSGVRRRLQGRFGDAGHGFHVLGRYNLAFTHQDIRFSDRGAWDSCEIIFKCKADGHYGYGAVSSESSGGGTSTWSTTKEGIGSRVSHFELWYAKQPKGGDFQIKVDGQVERTVTTASDQLQDGFETIAVPDGPHKFEVRAIGNGSARGYGVVLENAGPGVVWDSLALIGAFTQRFDYQDPGHIANQMKRRKLDLLVFILGGNDVQREKMDLYRTMQPYEEEYTRVIQKFRAGRPEASCLVMSVTDHGERVGRYGIRTRRIVPKLVASQQQVALAQGCAFFNTFEAMGGTDAIARWYHASPQLAGADFAHPTAEGHEVIAGLFFQSLTHSYARFRQENEGKPLPSDR
jgi:lysophospholipase L1-like esterase